MSAALTMIWPMARSGFTRRWTSRCSNDGRGMVAQGSGSTAAGGRQPPAARAVPWAATAAIAAATRSWSPR